MADKKLIDFYSDLHSSKTYGATSINLLRFIEPEVRTLKPRSIVDYGCGQSALVDRIRLPNSVRRERYDPAIPAFSKKPDGMFDLLINTDVLEHIRDEDLDATIAEMRSMCRNAIIMIDTKPAKLLLPSGENAHVSQHPADWWRERLGRHFPELYPMRGGGKRRAAFRTWRHTALQRAQYAFLRTADKLSRIGKDKGTKKG